MKKFVVLGVCMALSGCVGDKDALSYNSTTVWQLAQMNGKDATGQGTLQFIENGISGQGSCNRFRAEQRAEYPNFAAGPVAATKRACLKPGGDENMYFQTLEKVNSAAMTKDQLVLTGPNGSELVFTAGM